MGMRKKMEIFEIEMKMKTRVLTMKIMKNNWEHVPVPSTPSNFIIFTYSPKTDLKNKTTTANTTFKCY